MYVKRLSTCCVFNGSDVMYLLSREYQNGCDWEIYVSELSTIFEGVSFAHLSYMIYEKKGVVSFYFMAFIAANTFVRLLTKFITTNI